MSAAVLPFPITRRHGLIHKHATAAASMPPDSAVSYVEQQLVIQRDAMRRSGVAESLIARELRCMAAAMQRDLLQATSTAGDK